MAPLRIDPELPAVADFLLPGGKPGQLGMLEHIVERQQPPQEHVLAGRPAVAHVGDADRLVEPAAADPDQPGFAADGRDGLFDGHPGGEKTAYEAHRRHGAGVPPGGILGANEEAAVQADQGDPLGRAGKA